MFMTETWKVPFLVPTLEGQYIIKYMGPGQRWIRHRCHGWRGCGTAQTSVAKPCSRTAWPSSSRLEMRALGNLRVLFRGLRSETNVKRPAELRVG